MLVAINIFVATYATACMLEICLYIYIHIKIDPLLPILDCWVGAGPNLNPKP